METILTPEAKKFIEEWNSPTPYVTARTSGSTGTPKEIRLLKTDMRASAKATINFFGLHSRSWLHLPLSPDYIAGKMQIVRALESGATLTVEDATNRPLSGLSLNTGRRISLLPVVPSQVCGVLSSGFTDRIDNMIIGGAPLAPADEQRIIDSGIPSFATYGMTETCSHVALRRLGSECFSALPGFRFSADPRGCLVINSETMSFGQLVTNDIVELDSPQAFRWRGRFDNVINSGGLKISPEEIEKKIAHLFPDGTNFYITSRRSERWGEESTDFRSGHTADFIKKNHPEKILGLLIILNRLISVIFVITPFSSSGLEETHFQLSFYDSGNRPQSLWTFQ